MTSTVLLITGAFFIASSFINKKPDIRPAQFQIGLAFMLAGSLQNLIDHYPY